ncbi:outer membrane lipoprotein chaperone LolA [Alteromonas sp. BMJM2]|uniref:outer membrane lipoprotein chaperone LolA n=1 Tax=Alteromonas sp. BMJM2 TaxID=2954241 RepID=UPI0022B480A0|nr:outer membrane lipoprotein chaperone LolA [Alteromonas sp. BMJM2]
MKNKAMYLVRSVLLVAAGATSFVLNAQTQASVEAAPESMAASESMAAPETMSDIDTNDTSSLKTLLSDMRQFRANFAQTVVDAQQNVVHEAQGVLVMTRPDKLRWETTFPDETLLIADGEAVWNVDTFVEQVTVLSQANAIKDNPVMLLTSNDDSIWSMFSISQLDNALSQLLEQKNRSGQENTSGLRSFQITPKQQGGQILTLTLTFNSDNELAALTMLDAQQQISTLTFSDIETTFPLAADTFEVEVPDSFIIDDQR